MQNNHQKALILTLIIILSSDQVSTLAQGLERQPQLVLQLGHSTPVKSIQFSSDARFILTSGDRTTRLGELSTGREVRRFLGHEDGVSSAVFSPDDRMIVTGSADRLYQSRQ